MLLFGFPRDEFQNLVLHPVLRRVMCRVFQHTLVSREALERFHGKSSRVSEQELWLHEIQERFHPRDFPRLLAAIQVFHSKTIHTARVRDPHFPWFFFLNFWLSLDHSFLVRAHPLSHYQSILEWVLNLHFAAVMISELPMSSMKRKP